MPLGPVLPETSLVLDTNILTAWRYQRTNVIAELGRYQARLKLLPALTSITVHEALYGFENEAARSGGISERTTQDRLRTEQLMNACVVLPFDFRAAQIAAYLVPRLPKNIPKQTLLDALIAATALAHGYGIATNDRAFEIFGGRIPDNLILRLAFWKP